MAQASGIPIDSSKLSKTKSFELFKKHYREYLKDPEANPILKLKKEIEDLQKQSEAELAEAATYKRTIETIVKHEENFLHRLGLVAKTGTRTVGVYVNITSPEDKSNISNLKAAVSKPQNSASGQLSGPPLKQMKTEMGSGHSTSSQHLLKTNVVDVVDLTMEEDKNRLKYANNKDAIAITQPKQIYVTSTSQMVKGENFATVARPIYPLSSQIGTPQVQFPNNNVFSPVMGSNSAIQTQRPILVLPPNTSINVRQPINSKTEVPNQYIIGSGASVLLQRPPTHPILEINKPIPTYSNSSLMQLKHPAPLPEQPRYTIKPGELELPPKPNLKISRPATGIVLSWNMNLLCSHAVIKTYQLYGYDESSGAVDSSAWKKVGEVNALPLPMACTLTQFLPGRRYHFAIRALDIHSRFGPFSDVASISLLANSASSSK